MIIFEEIIAKICHDLANPVGATCNGIELYDDAIGDSALQAAAIDSARQQSQAASTLVRFYRLALATSHTHMVSTQEIILLLQEPALTNKVQFEWQKMPEQVSALHARLILLSAKIALVDLPRGGVVRFSMPAAHTRVHMGLQGQALRLKVVPDTHKIIFNLHDDCLQQLAWHATIDTNEETCQRTYDMGKSV